MNQQREGESFARFHSPRRAHVLHPGEDAVDKQPGTVPGSSK